METLSIVKLIKSHNYISNEIPKGMNLDELYRENYRTLSITDEVLTRVIKEKLKIFFTIDCGFNLKSFASKFEVAIVTGTGNPSFDNNKTLLDLMSDKVELNFAESVKYVKDLCDLKLIVSRKNIPIGINHPSLIASTIKEATDKSSMIELLLKEYHTTDFGMFKYTNNKIISDTSFMLDGLDEIYEMSEFDAEEFSQLMVPKMQVLDQIIYNLKSNEIIPKDWNMPVIKTEVGIYGTYADNIESIELILGETIDGWGRIKIDRFRDLVLEDITRKQASLYTGSEVLTAVKFDNIDNLMKTNSGLCVRVEFTFSKTSTILKKFLLSDDRLIHRSDRSYISNKVVELLKDSYNVKIYSVTALGPSELIELYMHNSKVRIRTVHSNREKYKIEFIHGLMMSLFNGRNRLIGEEVSSFKLVANKEHFETFTMDFNFGKCNCVGEDVISMFVRCPKSQSDIVGNAIDRIIADNPTFQNTAERLIRNFSMDRPITIHKEIPECNTEKMTIFQISQITGRGK